MVSDCTIVNYHKYIPIKSYLSMLKYVFVIFPILSSFIQLVQTQGSAETCYTPERRTGQCVNIRNCASLLTLLQSTRPLPDSTVEYLKLSQCGFEGRNPLVCCPYKHNQVTKPTSRPPTHSTKPSVHKTRVKDVTGHPSLRMMPEICGPITESKIIGGNVTDLFEYPWMALLGYTSRGSDEVSFRCGGSLINRKYVLTAAHCVSFLQNLKLTQIRLGEHDLRTDEDCSYDIGCAPPVLDYEIERVIPHPQYVKDDLRNDIAIIRLKETVSYSMAVRPICLPVGAEQLRDLATEKVTVTGWGATETGTTSPVLLKVDLPIVPLAECAAIYNSSVPITEKQLCAGGLNGRDSCGGDSGGPLQFVGQPVQGGLSYIQYGIVSFGPRQCGTFGRPGVYTRVGYYMDWILNNVKP